MAQHFAGAGQVQQAVTRFEQAARLAMQRAALVKSAGHLRQGLELLRQLPEPALHRHQELALRLALGNVMVAAHGYTAPEIGEIYTKARRLAKSLADDASLIRAATGQWSFHAMRGEMDDALYVARDLHHRAGLGSSRKVLPTSHRLMGASLVQSGDLQAARRHFDAAQAELARVTNDSETARMPEFRDTLVGVPAYLSVCLALMGERASALEQSEAALTEAKRLYRPHLYAFALSVAGLWCRGMLGEEIATIVDQLEALASKQDFPYWRVFAIKYRALMLACEGRFQDGLVLLREGEAKHRSMGAKWGQAYFLGTMAQYGDSETGLELVESALSLIASTGERWLLPELFGSGEWHCGPAATMPKLRQV